MTDSVSIPYRPFGLIKQLLEEIGFEVTHCYEDLIFIEHNPFLVQMGEKGEEVNIWFNADCEMDARSDIMQSLQGNAGSFLIAENGTYTMEPNEEDQTFQLKFRQNWQEHFLFLYILCIYSLLKTGQYFADRSFFS